MYKKPPVLTLGGRYTTQQQQILGIWDSNRTTHQLDGHVNRNIRMTFSLLQMVDPYIEVVGYNKRTKYTLVYFRVTGCADSIDMVQTVNVNNETFVFVKDKQWNCFLKGDTE